MVHVSESILSIVRRQFNDAGVKAYNPYVQHMEPTVTRCIVAWVRALVVKYPVSSTRS